jgi:hypothetical protein
MRLAEEFSGRAAISKVNLQLHFLVQVLAAPFQLLEGGLSTALLQPLLRLSAHALLVISEVPPFSTVMFVPCQSWQ